MIFHLNVAIHSLKMTQGLRRSQEDTLLSVLHIPDIFKAEGRPLSEGLPEKEIFSEFTIHQLTLNYVCAIKNKFAFNILGVN